jgi:hypothetical protein
MHRTSSKNRSLKVQRETLRTLASTELRSAHGGTVKDVSFNQVVNCRDIIDRNVFEGPPGDQSMPQGGSCPHLIGRDVGAFDPHPIARRP